MPLSDERQLDVVLNGFPAFGGASPAPTPSLASPRAPEHPPRVPGPSMAQRSAASLSSLLRLGVLRGTGRKPATLRRGNRTPEDPCVSPQVNRKRSVKKKHCFKGDRKRDAMRRAHEFQYGRSPTRREEVVAFLLGRTLAAEEAERSIGKGLLETGGRTRTTKRAPDARSGGNTGHRLG